VDDIVGHHYVLAGSGCLHPSGDGFDDAQVGLMRH
jgi:hypothetical protein